MQEKHKFITFAKYRTELKTVLIFRAESGFFIIWIPRMKAVFRHWQD